MATIDEIKRLQAQGWSVSAIAATLHRDRKTVRKYLQQTDFSPPPPTATHRPSKLDPYKPTIDTWLAADARSWYKPRHTAQRVYDRLRETFPEFAVSYPTVRRYVRTQRQSVPPTGTLERVWEPGEAAPVDFGQAEGWEADALLRLHFLCVSFPYSKASYLQRFRGENAECVVQGWVDILQHVGGAPQRWVFDNASGVGRRVGETVQLTELYQRFQAHYGLATTFCNPASGPEKGHVESHVGSLRRNLLVPPPPLPDLVAIHADFLRRSEPRWQRPHYKKHRLVADRFAEERERFRALPPQPFAPYRYPHVRTDRPGRFGLEGQHGYASAPEYAQQTVVVRIGAHTVEPLGGDGQPLTAHARVYRAGRSDSTDYRTTGHRVAQNPGAWRNSPLRHPLPESVRGALDTAAREDWQAALRGLAQCTDHWGFDHAVRALEAAVARGRTAYAVRVALGRLQALAPQPAKDSAVDLRRFDQLLEGRGPR